MNAKHLTSLLLGLTSTLGFAETPIEVTATFSPALAVHGDWQTQMKFPELKPMRGALEPGKLTALAPLPSFEFRFPTAATLEPGKPTVLEPLPSFESRFPTAAALDQERWCGKEVLWPTAFETRIMGPAVNLTATRQADGRILFHGTCRLTHPTGKGLDMSPTHHTVSLLTYETLFFGVAKVGVPFVVSFDKSAAKDASLTLTFAEPKAGS